MPTRIFQRSQRALAILGIGLLASLFRFAHLPDRGLYFWDEAKFALEGIRMEQGLRLVAGMHGVLASGKTVGSAKPGHALLIGVSYFVTGIHDYAPLLMNAGCSVGASMLLGVIGWRLFGAATGVTAAVLLAVSEYDVLYARSALSESDATLLLLAGFTLWLWPVPAAGRPAAGPRLLLSGVVLGAAFSTNYRLIVYLGVVVLTDLAWCFRRDGTGVTLRRTGIWLTGLLAVPSAWFFIGMFAAAGGSLIFFNEITGRPASYASEVVYQLHQGKQSVVHFDPVIYLGWYVVRNGVAATALLAIGLVWCLVRPTFTRVATVSLVLVPYGLYVFAPFIVPRNLVAALPFAALTAAVGLVQSARRWPPLHQPLVAIVPLALALAVIGASMSWRLTEERSGFASAALAVNRNGGRALTSSEVMVFYLRGSGGTCNAPAIPVRLRVLAADVRAGYRLAVLENHHNSAVTHYIKTHGRLVATWPAFGGPDIGESPIASENGNAPQAPGTPEVVSLYDLSSLRLPPPGHTHSQTCRLDLPT